MKTAEQIDYEIQKEINAIGDIRKRLEKLSEESESVLIVKHRIKNARLHLTDAINELGSCRRILNMKFPNEKS